MEKAARHCAHSAVPGILVYKNKITLRCEIGYFVETHLRTLCVILRSRVLRVVC